MCVWYLNINNEQSFVYLDICLLGWVNSDFWINSLIINFWFLKIWLCSPFVVHTSCPLDRDAKLSLFPGWLLTIKRMFQLHSSHTSVKSNLEKPTRRSQFIKKQEAHELRDCLLPHKLSARKAQKGRVHLLFFFSIQEAGRKKGGVISTPKSKGLKKGDKPIHTDTECPCSFSLSLHLF